MRGGDVSEKWYARETVLWKLFHLDYIQGCECDSSQGHESNGKQGDAMHPISHGWISIAQVLMYVLVDSAFDGQLPVADARK